MLQLALASEHSALMLIAINGAKERLTRAAVTCDWPLRPNLMASGQTGHYPQAVLLLPPPHAAACPPCLLQKGQLQPRHGPQAAGAGWFGLCYYLRCQDDSHLLSRCHRQCPRLPPQSGSQNPRPPLATAATRQLEVM